MNFIHILISALSDTINLVFVIIIFILAGIDILAKKDLKSQIVSIGVLGTFVGIFIGLQDFNPEDMKNSINHILDGLKTAFFTSIVGMTTAILISIFQRVFNQNIDDEKNDERILLEISQKLNALEKLDNTNNTDKIIGELERLRTIQTDARNETEKISKSIDELRINSNQENQKLINILDTNFEKMNNSLEIAIDKLSKGATEEIIKALKQVIEEFNQELQTQFGENFVELNKAVVNLVTWQENYKTHIETLEQKLIQSTDAIEKSKESLVIISSKNEDIMQVYSELKHIIEIYDRQINELNQHLQTYANLSSHAEDMFLSINKNISLTKEDFMSLTKTIVFNNEEQKNNFLATTNDIKQSYLDLTKHIQKQHSLEQESLKNSIDSIEENIKSKITEIKNNFDNLTKSFEENKKELDLMSIHFKNLGERVPKAVEKSLESLNVGLTSLTKEFQKDYKETMNNYRNNI